MKSPYQGIMNQPGSKPRAGHPDAVKLYCDYVKWLGANHSQMIE